ncbi:MAG TPA: outer membrane lipoprotein chaperone LolA [Vicinamibacteria bacterium]|nr:outer membrane lipoprotein chaperone LolA [Vicinamibacteria bacterium]
MRSPNAALRAAALALAAAPAAAAGTPAEDLARRVEERLLRAADMRARFTQTYRSGALGREVRERGTMTLKRPGRMRWEYEFPERKTFVSDGRTFYFYVPADRQVVVRDQKDAAGVAGLLLAGRGALLEPFAPEVQAAPTGTTRLRLVPRKADPEVEQIVLDLDADCRVRALEVTDPQGNRSRFEFDDVRENVGLRDDQFEFEPPRGVEVIAG